MLWRALILSVVTVVGLLPSWGSPEWQGTEGRRVQIALEMVRSGDWMVPLIGGQPTWAKPPLHYWALGACAKLFGEGVWSMRLPAVVFVFTSALLAMELLRRWFGARAGWLAALGILLSPVVLHEWATAEIDPTFASLTAMSLWLLATGVGRERRMLVVASGLVGGLAFLQKGPPYFLFAVGAYLVWWRRRNCRFAAAHFVPLLLVAAAYYVPLWLWRIGPSEMLGVAGAETIGRIQYFEWQHIQTIPGFWVRAIAVQAPFVFWCFWEWRGARDARMDAGDLTLRMCSGAAVIAVALLTLFPGRPTRYLLPNVLLFTFAVAPAVAHFSRQTGDIGQFVRRLMRIIGLLGALALLVLPFLHGGAPAVAVASVAVVAPFLVRVPLHLVVFCLLLPLVSAVVVGFDESGELHRTWRAREFGGRILRNELVARGAVEGLATYGHVDGALLLAAGVLPPGDEAARKQPVAPWLLCEAGAEPRKFAGYIERLRLCLPGKTFLLFERSEAPR